MASIYSINSESSENRCGEGNDCDVVEGMDSVYSRAGGIDFRVMLDRVGFRSFVRRK